MANSMEEALQETIDNLKAKTLIKDVVNLENLTKKLPGNYYEFLLAILHKVATTDGYNWSHKKLYIKDEAPYEVIEHYGGPKGEEDATRKFFEGKLDAIKQAKNFNFVELESVNEVNESAIVFAIKENIDKKAIIYRAKCWKTGATTWDYLLIEEITV